MAKRMPIVIAGARSAGAETVLQDADGWRARSAAHVSTRVNWRLVQPRFVELGARQVFEVGHGSMLAALAKRTIPGTPVVSVATPAAIDDLRT